MFDELGRTLHPAGIVALAHLSHSVTRFLQSRSAIHLDDGSGGESTSLGSQIHHGADDVTRTTGATERKAVILLGKSPGAMAFTVTPSLANFFASVDVRWCTAAFAGWYAQASSIGCSIPEIDPMLITRVGCA
jgi:hypothetical protein